MYVNVLPLIDKMSQEPYYILDPYYIKPMVLSLGSLLWGWFTWIFFVQLLRIILFYCFLYRIIVLWAQVRILSSYVISIKSNQYIYWYVIVCFPYTCFDVFGGYNPYSINFCIPDMDILSLSKFLNHVTTIFIHLQNSKAYKCPLF